MTRRRVVFFLKNGGRYMTPEFNGDKTEFELFKMGDKCDADWPEIFAEFNGVKSLYEFDRANERAQAHYGSHITGGSIFLPTEYVCDIDYEPMCDEVYYLCGDIRTFNICHNCNFVWQDDDSKDAKRCPHCDTNSDQQVTGDVLDLARIYPDFVAINPAQSKSLREFIREREAEFSTQHAASNYNTDKYKDERFTLLVFDYASSYEWMPDDERYLREHGFTIKDFEDIG